MTTGEFIRLFRKDKGISGPEMAKLLGVDYWRLQKWESGKVSPKYHDAAKISAYFKRNVGQELTEKDLNETLGAKYIPTEGIVTLAAEPEPMERLLDEKDKRIKELEEMVATLREALHTVSSKLK